MHQFRYLDAFTSLSVEDLTRAESWYRDALGFGVVFRTTNGLLHLRRSLGQDLILRRGPSVPTNGNGASVALHFAVDGKLDTLAQQAAQVSPDAITWRTAEDGTRELWVKDPDGHELVFYERISPRR